MIQFILGNRKAMTLVSNQASSPMQTEQLARSSQAERQLGVAPSKRNAFPKSLARLSSTKAPRARTRKGTNIPNVFAAVGLLLVTLLPTAKATWDWPSIPKEHVADFLADEDGGKDSPAWSQIDFDCNYRAVGTLHGFRFKCYAANTDTNDYRFWSGTEEWFPLDVKTFQDFKDYVGNRRETVYEAVQVEAHESEVQAEVDQGTADDSLTPEEHADAFPPVPPLPQEPPRVPPVPEMVNNASRGSNTSHPCDGELVKRICEEYNSVQDQQHPRPEMEDFPSQASAVSTTSQPCNSFYIQEVQQLTNAYNENERLRREALINNAPQPPAAADQQAVAVADRLNSLENMEEKAPEPAPAAPETKDEMIIRIKESANAWHTTVEELLQMIPSNLSSLREPMNQAKAGLKKIRKQTMRYLKRYSNLIDGLIYDIEEAVGDLVQNWNGEQRCRDMVKEMKRLLTTVQEMMDKQLS